MRLLGMTCRQVGKCTWNVLLGASRLRQASLVVHGHGCETWPDAGIGGEDGGLNLCRGVAAGGGREGFFIRLSIISSIQTETSCVQNNT